MGISKSTGSCDLDGLFFTLQQIHRADLLSVPLTTQTDIAPVKYNLELTGEWLLSFHCVSPSWLRSKGSAHQYPPQPLLVCFIIQRSDVFERNIAAHGLFQRLNPVNKPNSYTQARTQPYVATFCITERFARTRTSQKTSKALKKQQQEFINELQRESRFHLWDFFFQVNIFSVVAKMSRHYMSERQYYSLLSSKWQFLAWVIWKKKNTSTANWILHSVSTRLGYSCKTEMSTLSCRICFSKGWKSGIS